MCTADQPDNNTCLCRCHRNIRHGACGAWRACTRSSLTAPRSWSGSMRGRRRRSPSTGATATPTWTPRESSTMWVQEFLLLKWRNTSHPSIETLLSSAKYFPTRVRNQKCFNKNALWQLPAHFQLCNLSWLFLCTSRKWGWSWTQSKRWCVRSRKQLYVYVRRTTRPNRLWRWIIIMIIISIHLIVTAPLMSPQRMSDWINLLYG